MRNMAGNKNRNNKTQTQKEEVSPDLQASLDDFMDELPGMDSPEVLDPAEQVGEEQAADVSFEADQEQTPVEPIEEDIPEEAPPVARTKPNTNAPTTTVVGQTKGGRDIKISRTKDGRFFTISFEGGGVVPPELDGIFTNYNNAAWAVDAYKQRKGL